MGKIFCTIRIIIMLGITTLVLTASASEEEGLVIVEKPDTEQTYEIKKSDIFIGSPVIKKKATFWGFSYMKKEFTNTTSTTVNVPSTFYGLTYGYIYNWNHFSLSADVGFYYGSKDEELANEASNSGLRSSLANQTVFDIGFNLFWNSFDDYYVRPYFGAGGYYNRYTYIENDSSTDTTFFGISSYFVRAGFAIPINRFDNYSANMIWRDFGVYRATLLLEAKQYTPKDTTTNTSKAELTTTFMFEY